jgi:parallel beta-helix repeat protein
MRDRTSKILLLLLVLLTYQGILFGQKNIYIRSTAGQPWGSTSNEASMDAAFGSGNWQDLRFETINLNSVLSTAKVIFMEGSDDNANELEAFLDVNLPAIENWVKRGNVLFLNSAPNEGNGMNFGFGGISLIYSNSSRNVSAVDLDHNIFNGPFLPVGTNWSGGSFAHATVEGPDLVSLIVDSGNSDKIVLAEKKWGLGKVFFGGMTTTNFHSPSPEGNNLRSNILADNVVFVSDNDAGIASIDSPVDFCEGSHDITVTIENFGINIINSVTVNWSYDGAIQPAIPVVTTLDTLDGVGANTTSLILGNRTFLQGVSHEISAWTSFPNGVMDTVTVNDTISVTVQPSLDGTFTIGGATPDYVSFNEAITALSTFGVCGPVVFNVRNGTYEEQITIPEVRGTSAANTITFQSETADSTSVILTTSSSTYTIGLNGADYLRFKNITITTTATSGRVIELFSAATNNHFLNNIIQGPNINSTSSGHAVIYSPSGSDVSHKDSSNVIQNNAIIGGSYGIYFTAYSNTISNREYGNIITGNTYTDQYYTIIYLEGQNEPEVVSNNFLKTNPARTDFYGLQLYSSNNIQYLKNRLDFPTGGYGMYIQESNGDVSQKSIIANNFMSISGTNNAYGIYSYLCEYYKVYNNNFNITSTNEFNGYSFFDDYGCTNFEFINNIMVNTGGGYAMYVNTNTISNSNHNNFYTTGSHFIYRNQEISDLQAWRNASSFDSLSISVNPVFSTNTDLHVKKAILDGAGLSLPEITDDIDGDVRHLSNPDIGADEFTAVGSDASLVYLDYPHAPFTAGTYPIRAAIKNSGASTLSSLTIKWEVDSALQTPYNWTGSLALNEIDTVVLGNYTFNSATASNLISWTINPNGEEDIDASDDSIKVYNIAPVLLAGTYTIGGANPDFTTISEVVDIMNNGGILGAVTFNIRNGTYAEQLNISEIVGASLTNTITFQSESGDSTSVVITNSAVDVASNYTIRLNSADYITFKSLTLEATGVSYANVVDLNSGANHNQFLNNIIRNSLTTSSSNNLCVIYSPNGNSAIENNNGNAFRKNHIVGGSYGIQMTGYGSAVGDRITGTIIDSNTFENQYYAGVYIYNFEAPEIVSNTIFTNAGTSNYFGIYSRRVYEKFQYTKNKISILNGGYGIYIYQCYSSLGNETISANNFISIGGTSSAYGILVQNSDYHNFYHNNVNVTSTYTSGYALYSSGGSFYSFINNILVNNGGGYAIYVNTTGAIASSDYNNFYATGTNLGYWSGNRSNLSSWQTASGHDANSLSVNPVFASVADLHINKGLLKAAGTPIASVIDDIDGEVRNATTPDIGADEFTPIGVDASLTYLEYAHKNFGVGTNPIRLVVRNSGGTTLTSFNIDWNLNATAQPTYSWTGSLASGESDTLTIGSVVFAINTLYNLQTTITSPNGTTDIDTLDNAAEALGLYASLGGVYTIGGITPDFTTLNDAANALAVSGVWDHVYFNIRTGIYNEQISIGQFDGSSDQATVTFQSETGDSTSVVLNYSSTSGSNYVIQLDGADHVIIKNLTLIPTNATYGTALSIRNGSSYNQFLNNIFQGVGTTSTGTTRSVIYSESGNNNDMNDHNNSFKNNAIINGSYGMYYYGWSSNDENRETGTLIEGNTFTDQYYMAMRIQNQQAPIIIYNTISTSSSRYNYFGMYISYCYNGTKISNNDIQILSEYGIYMQNSHGGYEILNNKVTLANGRYGIYLYDNDATAINRGIVANNVIGIYGSNTSYGLRTEYCDYQSVLHNSVNVNSSQVANSTFAYRSYSGIENIIINNIFANSNGGYPMYVGTPESVLNSDHNNLYTTGSLLGYWTTDQATLNDWQTASGFDANSYSINPRFVSNSDLHTREVLMNDRGTPLVEVTHDFDGEPRSTTTPDIGADEFTPKSADAGVFALTNPTVPFNLGNQEVTVALRNNGVDTLKNVIIDWELNGIGQDSVVYTGSLISGDTMNVTLGTRVFDPATGYTIKAWTDSPNGVTDGDTTNDTIFVDNLYTALDGVYTIGGTTPDFNTFQDAVNALVSGGVVDSAIFNVRTGTYNEQISIPELNGPSVANTVVFQSESGDSTDVVLTYSANSTNRYTLQLNGADGITFRNITMSSINNSYGTVLDIRGGANNITIRNNQLLGRVTTSSSTNMAVIFSGNDKDDNNHFINNKIVNGSYGIYAQGKGSNAIDLEVGTSIQNNIFENQYYSGMWLYYNDSHRVIDNFISTNTNYNYFYGIYTAYSDNGHRIENNQVYTALGGYGIFVEYCDATSATPGIIANNVVKLAGTNDAYALYLYQSNYQHVYHNTFSTNSTTSLNNNIVAYFYQSYDSDIKNNIFTNFGDGYTFYVNNSSLNSNYNNLFTTGPIMGYYSGDQNDLAAWQANSGYDLNSYSIDPRFVSDTDLHTREILMNDTGTPLAEVTIDIDNEPRDPATPDIGADEFIPPPVDAGVVTLINPVAPFTVGTQNVIVSLKNHGLDTLTNVEIGWTVNDTLQTAVNWTGMLLSGDTVDVALDSYNFETAIAYNISSWTINPNGASDADGTNDSISVSNIYSALGGSYTIGGTSPNFTSFGEAVNAMVYGGIVDSVIFNVRNGNYNEQIRIPEILGASETSKIIFQSEVRDRADVLLNTIGSANDNYTVQLDGADYVTFRDLSIGAQNATYGRVIDITNGANYNRFENNVFYGIANSNSSSANLAIVYSSSNSIDEYNLFVNNKFSDGSYGVYYYGRSANFNDLERGMVVEGNLFENQYYSGIMLYYQNSTVVSGNTITTNSAYTSFYAIQTYYNDYNCQIVKNKIVIPSGGYGIYLYYNDGNSANRALIANNFITIGGTTTARGIYCYYSNYQNIYHNTISITSTLTNTNAVSAYVYEGGNINLKNNILSNFGGGYAIYQYSTSSFSSDYNDLYAKGMYLGYWGNNHTDLAAWRSYSGLDSHSYSVDPYFYSPTDLHVYNAALNASAQSFVEITDDIDGNIRTATPDIGADEFIPPTEDAGITSIDAPVHPLPEGTNLVKVTLLNNSSAELNSVTIGWEVNGARQTDYNWTGTIPVASSDTVTVGTFYFFPDVGYGIKAWTSAPNGLTDKILFNDTTSVNGLYVGMSGTYYIGGVGADFINFTSAVQSLHDRGIGGPVNFIVTNGIYNEQIRIGNIVGSSATNIITFESAVKDSTAVTLSYSANSTNQYTLLLDGTDYMTFKNMTIEAVNGSYARAVSLRNGADYITLENNIIKSPVTTGASTNRTGVFSSGNVRNQHSVLRNNRFRDGAYGIYLNTGNNGNADGTTIEDNIFEDQYAMAMFLYYQNGPIIKNNDIFSGSNYTNSYRGVLGDNWPMGSEISSNKISVLNSGGKGIEIQNSTSNSTPHKIFNNFISINGNLCYGIEANNASNLEINYNNINVTSTNVSSGRGLYFANATSIRLRNNVVMNSGGGYAMYSTTSNAISTSDYNDLFTTGVNLAYINGINYIDLATLQGATGRDTNSKSIDPNFIGISDLHVTQPNLDGAGTPIATITTDIDGQIRHLVTPDIGADEFGAGLLTNDIGIVSLLAPNNACVLGSAEDITVRIQNYGVDTISNFAITYVINDTTIVTDSVSSYTLLPGRSTPYTFSLPADLSNHGLYDFLSYTQLLNDSTVANDTLKGATIHHYPSVNASVSDDVTICSGVNTTLYATGGNNYQWRILGSDNILRYGSSYTVSPANQTTYFATVLNEFDCSDTDTVTVSVLPAPPKPVISIIGEFGACTQDTIQLMSNIKGTIVWSTGDTTQSILVIEPGTYKLTNIDTLTGCSTSSSVSLSHSPVPYIQVFNNPICSGQSTTLSVVNGATYQWDTGETTSSITVSPNSATTYNVHVVNAQGCEYDISRTISVTPTPPTPTITSVDGPLEICAGAPAVLSVIGDAQQYNWNTGQHGANITVFPTSTTTYTVTASNGQCGSTVSAQITVNTIPLPTAPIIIATGSSTLSFCDADTITLIASNYVESLLWSTGDTTQSIKVYDPGTYSVSYTNPIGCSAISSVKITDPPTPYIAGKSTVCEGETVTLGVNNGAFYIWSTGETTRTIDVTPAVTTTYSVDIKNEEGCTYTDSVRVIILPIPRITGISGDTTICAGSRVELNVSGSADLFLWTNGAQGTKNVVTPTETTTYGVNATNGCTLTNFNDYSEVTVFVNPLPGKPVITPTGSAAICEGSSIVLTSSLADSIIWSTGEITQTITVSEAGNYTVTRTNIFGCTTGSTTEVLNPEPAAIVASGFTTLCKGDAVTLTFTNTTSQNWSTGATTASISVSPLDSTTYYVTGVNDLGCVYNDSIRVNILDPVPPGMVSNMLPGGNSEGLSLPIAFSWAPAINASHYDIYIWDSTAVEPVTPTVENLTQISTLYSNLTYGATYNWRVVSKNSCHQTLGPIETFALRELPDLVVNKVLTPKSTFSGKNIDVTWEVKNTGDGHTGSVNWIDAIYLSADSTFESGVDKYVAGASNLTALDSGQSYIRTASFTLPKGIAGEYYVFITTDNYNRLQELDNNNNRNRNNTSMLVKLTPPPDLQVTQVVTLNNVFSGQPMNVSWTVENKGSGVTDAGSWIDRIYISSDSLLRTNSAVNLGEVGHSGILNAGESYTGSTSVVIPKEIFGTYFIHVQADARNQLFEHAFESNNNGRNNGMEVILAPPPDLFVTTVSMPDSASNKEAVNVQWTVINQGGSPISGYSWKDRVYISTDSVFVKKNAIDISTAGISQSLNLGESYTYKGTVKIPDGITGPHYLFVETDIEDKVFEYENEANNRTKSTSTIVVLTPDLIVSSVQLPDSAASGKPINVKWSVENIGLGNLNAGNWSDRISISNSAIYVEGSVMELAVVNRKGSILPGQSTLMNQSIILPEGIQGRQFIHVQTNYSNSIYEALNTNNNKGRDSLVVDLSPWPDLQVENVLLGITEATAGDKVDISFSAANKGVVPVAGYNWKDEVYLTTDPIYDTERDTVYLKQFTQSKYLEIDSSYATVSKLDLDTELVTGEYYFHFRTDAQEDVYEHTDEDNNVLTVGPITISEYPPVDLHAKLLTAPDSAFSGKQIKIQWEVENIGQGATLAPFWYDGVFLSKDTIYNEFVDLFIADFPQYGPIASGANYMEQQTITLPNGVSGDFYLLLASDHSLVEENTKLTRDMDLSNNFVSAPIKISLTPSPDLQVTTIKTPTQGISGQPISISWTVGNEGVGPTEGGQWVDRIYLSTDFKVDKNDAILGTFNHSGNLGSTESYSETMEVILPIKASGNQIIIIKTDDNDVLYEHKTEDNNTITSLITVVQPLPTDLIVTNVAGPAFAIVGEQIEVEWTVKNTGVNPATGKMEDIVYFSKDAVWDIGDAILGVVSYNINLAPLSENTKTLTAKLGGVALGDYHVIVRTDAKNNIFESADNNNEGASKTSTNVDVNELQLFVTKEDTLGSGVNLYYRVEIVDSLLNETMLISLKGLPNADNELYLKYGDIPTRTSYDFAHKKPFSGSQEVVVPNLKVGTYYLLVYGKAPSVSQQPINLLATRLDFEIRGIETNVGGDNGSVTVILSGSKFTPDMMVRLEDNNVTIDGANLHYIDPTTVYVTFDLNSAELGYYDVVAEGLNGKLAILPNGFKVVTGTGPQLLTEYRHPASTRPGRIVAITIDFANGGNVDIALPVRAFISVFGAPVAYTVADLKYNFDNLNLEFKEPEGPQYILRPGALSSITVYTKAVAQLRFKILK